MGGSRFLIMVAVLGSYIAAAIVTIFGALVLGRILIGLFTRPDLSEDSSRYLVLECIQLIDTFLLGTAFYIVALGLYELFISRHSNTPKWLIVHSLDDLKAKLLGMIIVVLSVFFLAEVINWDGKRDILSLGIAEALVIAAITFTIKLLESTQIAEIRRKETAPGPQMEAEENEL